MSKAQDVIYSHYTTREGLPSNKIYSIAQDHQGYIWIGTDKGIVKFNGKTFKIFTVEDGLPTNDVFYFFVDPMNRVWLYDYTPYLTYIKNDTVHTFRIFPETVPFNKKLFYYHNGLVFTGKENKYIVIGGDQGAITVRIEKAIRKIFPGYDSTSNGAADYVTYTGDRLLVHDHQGTSYYDITRNLGKFYHFHPDIDSFPFKKERQAPTLFDPYLAGVPKNRPDMLIFLDLNTGMFRKIALKKYFPDFTSSRTLVAQKDELQVSTGSGLLVIGKDLEVKDVFRLAPNLQKTIVNTIYKDLSGSYWLSTFNDGIYLVTREMKRFQKTNLGFTDAGSTLTSVYQSDKQYFIFDEEDRLYITDSNFHLKKKLQLHTNISFQTDPKSILLFKDEGRGHYIIASKGIYFLDKENKLYSIFEYLGNIDPGFLVHGVHSFKSAHFDAKSRKLIFLNHSSVYKVWFDKVFHKEDVLHKRFTNICTDLKGRYWMSDDLGNLSILDSNFRIITTYNIRNPITKIFTDKSGNVIFSVDGKGIFVYNTNRPAIRQLYNGGDVQVLNVDSFGLWFATNNFIRRFIPAGDHYSLANTYLNLQGLLYRNIYAIYPEKDSFLLLCDKGIIRTAINGTLRDNKEFTESVYISAIVTGDKRTVLDKNTRQFDQKYFNGNTIFEFTSNSTPYLGNVYYEYFLEGNDDTWQTSTEESFSYPALSPGIYKLHIKAIVKNAPIVSREKILTINIIPLWRQTLWFKALVVLMIMGLAAYLVYLRIRAIRQNEQKNTLLHKKMSELELSALQAQMNPHFIFNALSAVQNYIKTQDVQLAEESLRKFSMLIRLYLEFSRHKKITLAQELKALQLYTEIEQLRFNNKFDVVIKVRSSQAIESALIPPMMIQPLVENAINHGLYHKPSRGLLKIIFWVKKEQLIVFIDDNGIGREAARKLRNKIFPSRGNTLIRERIEILKASGLADASITIRDKLSRDNTPGGTRVILKMNIPQYD